MGPGGHLEPPATRDEASRSPSATTQRAAGPQGHASDKDSGGEGAWPRFENYAYHFYVGESTPFCVACFAGRTCDGPLLLPRRIPGTDGGPDCLRPSVRART